LVRIRTRPAPTPSGAPRTWLQLNLSDLLDAAMTILPQDAYALLLVSDHDLYEDDDDDFACGRAFGADRVAVVSAARYGLGEGGVGVGDDHVWPVAHCKAFVEAPHAATMNKRKRGELPSPEDDPTTSTSPMHRAVAAYTSHLVSIPPTTTPTPAPTSHPLTLFRICKTASHELAHCLGLDHCVYHACVMQGTAGLAEDERQPPFLCPVCRAKWEAAVGGGGEARDAGVREGCARCGEGGGVGETGEERKGRALWRAFGAWLEGVAEAEKGTHGNAR
ncbi:hypothetical protein HDU96_004389, partial [Phlyctochytrium bullatum]